MESSETQQQVIRLGKKLVKELGDDRADTLSQWMAHYIAEKIFATEKAEGKTKKELEKSCYEAILNLWAHRSDYPENIRPLKQFETIFKTIGKLDPDSRDPLYSYFKDTHDRDKRKLCEQEESVQEWLKVALSVDDMAKVMIEFSLRQAFEAATDERTKEWIKEARKLPGDEYLSVIVKFIGSTEEDDPDVHKIRQQEIGRLKDRIQKIKAFNRTCLKLLEAYSTELAHILEQETEK